MEISNKNSNVNNFNNPQSPIPILITEAENNESKNTARKLFFESNNLTDNGIPISNSKNGNSYKNGNGHARFLVGDDQDTPDVLLRRYNNDTGQQSNVNGTSVVSPSGTQFTVTPVPGTSSYYSDDPGSPRDAFDPLLTPPSGFWNAFSFSDPNAQLTVQSIASMGMGCTDGKKLYLRRVPTTASELMSMVNPVA